MATHMFVHVPGACRGQRQTLDLPELDLHSRGKPPSPLQEQNVLLTNEPFIQFLLLLNWKGCQTFSMEEQGVNIASFVACICPLMLP